MSLLSRSRLQRVFKEQKFLVLFLRKDSLGSRVTGQRIEPVQVGAQLSGNSRSLLVAHVNWANNRASEGVDFLLLTGNRYKQINRIDRATATTVQFGGPCGLLCDSRNKSFLLLFLEKEALAFLD